MPSYDYFCEHNGRTVEAKHSIQEKLQTWGELCRIAEIDPGDTPLSSPVTRLITGTQVVRSSALKNPEPACGAGGCASGVCGMR